MRKLLTPFKRLYRLLRHTVGQYYNGFWGGLGAASAVALIGYLGYQAAPPEFKQAVSIEGLQELTNAILSAIDRSHEIEEGLR